MSWWFLAINFQYTLSCNKVTVRTSFFYRCSGLERSGYGINYAWGIYVWGLGFWNIADKSYVGLRYNKWRLFFQKGIWGIWYFFGKFIEHCRFKGQMLLLKSDMIYGLVFNKGSLSISSIMTYWFIEEVKKRKKENFFYMGQLHHFGLFLNR